MPAWIKGKTQMRIKKRIALFMVVAVFVPVIFSMLLTIGMIKKHEKVTEETYLSTILASANSLLEQRQFALKGAGSLVVGDKKFVSAVVEKKINLLNSTLVSLCNQFPYLDGAIVIDKNLQVVAANDKDIDLHINERLHQITKKIFDSAENYSTTEKLPISSFFKQGSLSYKRMLVKIQDQESYLENMLVNIHVIPIFFKDVGRPDGLLLLIDAYNNDKLLTHYFARQTQDAFISVSIDGIRISTNIFTDKKSGYIGSRVPKNFEIKKVKKDVYFGEQSFGHNNTHFFIDVPLLNAVGETVGMLGVGIPKMQYEEIFGTTGKFITFIYLAVLGIILVFGIKFFGKISYSVEKITDAVRKFASNELEMSSVSDKNLKSEFDEIYVLEQTFKSLIDQLGKKEEERKRYIKDLLASKEKIQDLAKELSSTNERLEFMVEEKTENLKVALRELQEADKAKAVFIAKVSHELRTPLNFIIGATGLLNNEAIGILNDKQKKYVSNIGKNGEHLLLLINDILDVTKLTAYKVKVKIEKFSLKDTLDRSISIVQNIIEKKNSTVTTEIEDGDIILETDEHKLSQILYNLLSNAVKFTLADGCIHVKITKHGEYCEIRVKDNGIGIAEEDQRRVFVEFEQVDSSYSKQYDGTGLGLPIVKKLSQLLGGGVTLYSVLGEGSEFMVKIPMKYIHQTAIL